MYLFREGGGWGWWGVHVLGQMCYLGRTYAVTVLRKAMIFNMQLFYPICYIHQLIKDLHQVVLVTFDQESYDESAMNAR